MGELLITMAVTVAVAAFFVDLWRPVPRVLSIIRWIRAVVRDVNYAAVRQRELQLGLTAPRRRKQHRPLQRR